jgi:hypothetical protein
MCYDMTKMDPKNSAMKLIRTAVAATTLDNRAQVIQIALTLQRHSCFEVTVVGCAGISGFGTFLAVPPIVGGPVPNFGSEVLLKRRRAAIKKYCDEISTALKTLDEKPQIDYIEGSFHQIATTLSSTFDLVVAPHTIEIPSMLGFCYPDFDTKLVLSKPAPTLFCVNPLEWQSIIIVRTNDPASWWATQILSRMSDQLNVPVYQWFPRRRNGMTPRIPRSTPILLSVPEIIGPLDAASILPDQQADICLVIPGSVVRSIFRFRKVRRILRRWQGDCLVWP